MSAVLGPGLGPRLAPDKGQHKEHAGGYHSSSHAQKHGKITKYRKLRRVERPNDSTQI